jgi:hypothetical protein
LRAVFIILCQTICFMTQDNPPNQEPQQDVIADYANDLQEIEMEGHARSVRKARNALFWAGGLLFLGEMISMFRISNGFEPIIFIIALVEAGVFIGLAFWTKQKPYTAVVAGLIAFIAILLLSVVINGYAEGSIGVFKALFSGIIIKVVILVNLILPLRDAKELQEMMKKKY